MSITIAIDDGASDEVATNRGWGDFCRWAETLGVERFHDIVHLTERGWSEPADEFVRQLRAAVAESPPDAGTAVVAACVIELLSSVGADAVVLVTNGMTSADDDDQDDE